MSAPAGTGRRAGLGLLLLVACVGSFVTALDTTVLNIALPSLRTDLGAGAAELQWIVAIYPLVFAALIFLGGALGDVHGHRRVLLGGLVLFGLGSVSAATSSTSAQLIVGRVVTGAGAGFLTPAALAEVSVHFTGPARPRAVSLTSAATGLAVAVGPLLAGVLVEWAGWPSVFWINVPVVVLGVAVGWRAVPETPVVPGRRVDVGGVVLVSAAFLVLLTGCISAGQDGTPVVAWLGPLVASAALFAWFARHERRRRDPMLDLALFRNKLFAGGVILGVILQVAVSAAFVFVATYYQSVRGDSPVTAGLFYLPTTATIFVLSPVVGVLCSRIGLRTPAVIGSVTSAVAAAMLVWLSPTTPVAYLLVSQLLFGVGIAFTAIPITTAILNGAPSARAGIASASNNAAQRVGNAIGIGALGSLLVVTADRWFSDAVSALGLTGTDASTALVGFHPLSPPGGTSSLAQAADSAFVRGLAVVMGVGAVINLAGVLVARHFLPSGPIEPSP
ncbi:MAG: MFS transporter [Acidimicrobiales bacterium]